MKKINIVKPATASEILKTFKTGPKKIKQIKKELKKIGLK